MVRYLSFIVLLCSSIASFAQPGKYGCQHWRRAGINYNPPFNSSRELNPSIFRSDTFDILHYDISIDLTDYQNQRISAETKVRFVPKIAGQQNIRFDLVRLTVDSVLLNDQALTFGTDSEYVSVQLPQALQLNDTTELRFFYHGQPYRDPVWGGFIYESGYIYNLGIGLSTIPPNFGKVWYPCFDSFVERATYSYHVKTSGPYRAHCQGDFLGETALGGDTVIRSYLFNLPIPTHLSAIAASDYHDHTFEHPGLFGNVPVKLTARTADTAAMRNKFQHLGSAIDACEYWYGQTGWPVVGYVTASMGALEIAGNIAYPDFMLTPSVSLANNRDLIAHELGHYWWGNWIAPFNHNDMWLKEGPAEYSSHLTTEELEGHDAFIRQVKDNHKFVLQQAHVNDGGYFPLSPMPDAAIYGDHTYYKGASVMHNLRGYLGDVQFRQAMTQIQQNHPFETITPDQFRQYIEEETGFDATDFFEDQVYKPGFSVFVVDSFRTTGSGTSFNTRVNIQQKLRRCPEFYGEVPIDLTLVGAQRQRFTSVVTANGQYSEVNVGSDFEPVMVILNGNNRLNQARTDFEKVFAPGETVSNGILPYSEFRVFLDSLPDSTLFRVDHIWSAPDSSLRDAAIDQFSPEHYWHVDGIWPEGAELRGQLNYDAINNNSFDFALYDATEAAAILIYRENAGMPWRVYPDFTLVAGSLTNGAGFMRIDKLRKGDYAFANGDITAALPDNNQNPVSSLRVFPNPANTQLQFILDQNQPYEVIVEVLDLGGRLIQRASKSISAGDPQMLMIDLLPPGNYLLNIRDSQGKSLGCEPFQKVQ